MARLSPRKSLFSGEMPGQPAPVGWMTESRVNAAGCGVDWAFPFQWRTGILSENDYRCAEAFFVQRQRIDLVAGASGKVQRNSHLASSVRMLMQPLLIGTPKLSCQ